MNDKENEKKFKFRLAESIEKAPKDGLLKGFQIHVTKSVKPEPQQMKGITIILPVLK